MSVTKASKPEDIPTAFQAALNAHSMLALADLFEEDATFVNRFGRVVRGREAIVAPYLPIHETIYSNATPEK